MSIFDPHELYVHHQKSTRKGQVIQKHPVRRTGALTEDQIPQALQVLTAYGYTIYRPGFRPFRSFSVPFVLSASGLHYTSFFFSFNTVWSALRNLFPGLQTFISQNPIVNNSNVGISFSSMFLLGKVGHFSYKFYNNGTLNIDRSYNLGSDPSNSFSITFGPSSSQTLFISYDLAYASTAVSGETNFQNRIESSDVPSTLCYAIIENKWSELITNSGLTTDVKLFEGARLSEGSEINYYVVNGFLTVNINL